MVVVVVLALLIAAACGWWLYRGGVEAERRRAAGLAAEAEAHRVADARADEKAAVDAATAHRRDQQARPGVDRANERLRRMP